MPFQSRVNTVNPFGVEGDFASANPRASVLTSAGGFVAGPLGVAVGQFAWLQADGRTVVSYGVGGAAPTGFVHRDQQALITQYLAEESMIIPPGFPVVLHDAGDFFDLVTGATAATIGAACYANNANGALVIGSAPTGASVTGSIGSTNTAAIGSTFTATGTGTALVVTGITGVLSVGDTISGTGVPAGTKIVGQVSGTTGSNGTYTTSVATTAAGGTVTSFGTVLVVSATTGLISIGDSVAGGAGFPAVSTIVSQLSGTTGGAGSYTLSAPATAYVASATGITTYGTVVDVTTIGSGVLAVGDAITGTGVPSGASIASQVSGTPGGIGIYTINVPATAYAASTTITVVAGVLTKFVAKVACAVGELTKISTWGN